MRIRGLSLTQIGAKLNRAPNTISVRLSRIRQTSTALHGHQVTAMQPLAVTKGRINAEWEEPNFRERTGEMIEQKIRAYLEQIHMTQTVLSRLTGISIPKINLVLTGKRRLALSEYEVICWVLNVGVDKFIQPQKPVFKTCNDKGFNILNGA